MKKFIFGILTIGITIFVMYSCEKESEFSKMNNNLTFRSDKMQNSDSIQDESQIETFAKALSMALYNEESLRDFVKEKTDNNGKRNKEIILSCIKDVVVKKDSTFNDYINKYSNNSRLIEDLVTENPLLIFKIPDRLINMDWNTTNPMNTPWVKFVCCERSIIYFFNGKKLNPFDFLPEKTEVLSIIIKNAEKHLIVNKDDFTINRSNRTLAEYFDLSNQKVIDCLTSYLAEKSKFCLSNNQYEILIDIIDMMNYVNECLDLNNTVGTNVDPSYEGICPTIRNIDYRKYFTTNHYEGLELINKNSFDYINNQPCGEDLFAFKFLYQYLYNNGNTPQNMQVIAVANYNDLMVPREYEIELHYDDDGNSWVIYKWEIDEHPKYWEFPQKIFIFSESEFENNWTLEDKGDRFTLDISEFDENYCNQSSSNSDSETHTFSTNLNVSFFKPVYTSGGITYSYTHSTSSSVNMSYSAANIVSIGTRPITYCTQQEESQNYLFGTVLNLRIGVKVKDIYW